MVGVCSDVAHLQSQGRTDFSLHVPCVFLCDRGTDLLLGRNRAEVTVRSVGFEEWERAERRNRFLEGLRPRGGAVERRYKYADIGPRQARYRLELAVPGYRRVIDSVSAAQHNAVTVRQHAVGEAHA